MDAESSWFKRHLPDNVGVVAFLLVLATADWVVYAASRVIFKFDPAAVPDSFYIAYESEPDVRGIKYDSVPWKDYGAEAGRLGIRTLLLPEPAGRIKSKGDSMSFVVLENDGGPRQLIEVKYDGAYRSHSRYEAYRDRAVPIAYRSYGWGDPLSSHAAIWAGAVLLAGLAAWGAAFGVKRLMRLQRT
jgi:hypothetical protein